MFIYVFYELSSFFRFSLIFINMQISRFMCQSFNLTPIVVL